jgi:hypothetical protein
MRGKKAKKMRAENARLEKAVLAGLTAWWDGQKEQYEYSACILTARVASDVLTHFKVPHRVVAVKSNAMNQQRYERVMNLADSDDGITFLDGEYCVGANDGEVSERGFGGHVVVITSGDTLVDLSNYQFDRPEHNIVTGDNVRTLKMNGAFHSFVNGKELTIQLEQGHLFYWATDVISYRDAPDWRVSYRMSKEAIEYVGKSLIPQGANA